MPLLVGLLYPALRFTYYPSNSRLKLCTQVSGMQRGKAHVLKSANMQISMRSGNLWFLPTEIYSHCPGPLGSSWVFLGTTWIGGENWWAGHPGLVWGCWSQLLGTGRGACVRLTCSTCFASLLDGFFLIPRTRLLDQEIAGTRKLHWSECVLASAVSGKLRDELLRNEPDTHTQLPAWCYYQGEGGCVGKCVTENIFFLFDSLR